MLAVGRAVEGLARAEASRVLAWASARYEVANG
jgi:hypothetical protein